MEIDEDMFTFEEQLDMFMANLEADIEAEQFECEPEQELVF